MAFTDTEKRVIGDGRRALLPVAYHLVSRDEYSDELMFTAAYTWIHQESDLKDETKAEECAHQITDWLSALVPPDKRHEYSS